MVLRFSKPSQCNCYTFLASLNKIVLFIEFFTNASKNTFIVWLPPFCTYIYLLYFCIANNKTRYYYAIHDKLYVKSISHGHLLSPVFKSMVPHVSHAHLLLSSYPVSLVHL